MSGTDRYDYMGRCRARQMGQSLVERRRMAIRIAPQICVKIAGDDDSVSELLFDGPPTLSQLMAEAGGNATIVSVEKQDRAVRVFGGSHIAAE